MSTHSSRYAAIINMKQSSRDKCAISVKVSSEFWTSSIVSNTGKFVRKSTACFDVNRMTLISCPLQLLPTGNILTLQYYKTFGGFFLLNHFLSYPGTCTTPDFRFTSEAPPYLLSGQNITRGNFRRIKTIKISILQA